MSWKIYNGFILNNTATLEDALEYFKAQIKDFNAEADDYWRGMIISHAIAQYDNDCADGIKPTKDYIKASLGTFWEEERESSQKGYKSITDVCIGVSVCPVIIKKKPRIIGIAFVDNKRLCDKFFALPEIEEYMYYDNTDIPKDVSITEWKTREKVWKKVFKDYATANKVMFGFDLIANSESMRSPEITQEHFEKYVMSFDERLKGAVNERLLKNKSFPNFNSYVQYIKSEEALEARSLIEPIIRDRLTINIALNDLRS